jgi:hypothetical protein
MARDYLFEGLGDEPTGLIIRGPSIYKQGDVDIHPRRRPLTVLSRRGENVFRFLCNLYAGGWPRVPKADKLQKNLRF